jgi:cysteinyl-tRNA synthetase
MRDNPLRYRSSRTCLRFGVFDILVRYFRSQELRVVYVQNVTDIDDPLFEKALNWEYYLGSTRATRGGSICA